MKTTTLIDKYKEENTETVSQIEANNGFHPLHSATSSGPFPMCTDPINLSKWYKMVLEKTSATVKQNAGQKVFKTPLWKLQNWTSADKRSQVITENSQLQKEQHMDSFTAACSLQASHH